MRNKHALLDGKMKQDGDRRPINGQRDKKGQNGSNGKFIRKGGKKPFDKNKKPDHKKGGDKKDKSMSKEDLDKELEGYWLKGGNKELLTSRLDKELDDYFTKEPATGEAKEAEAKVEDAAAEQNPESAPKA